MRISFIKMPLLLGALLLFVRIFTACSFETTEPATTPTHTNMPLFKHSSVILSQMSEVECIEFIVENGVDIPDGFADNPGLGEFVKSIIQAVEINPGFMLVRNNNVVLVFFKSIKTLVNNYYSTTHSSSFLSPSATTRYTHTLQDSELYGAWDNSYYTYNCYSYAIDRTETWWCPGGISGNIFDINWPIDVMANYVKDDLEAIGYSKIFIDTMPVSPELDEKLICIRRSLTGAPWDQDFHFMRYNADDDSWYHKPGWTSILRYIGKPTNSRVWL